MDRQKKFFFNKKVLITGASGFIGRHLLDRLQVSGAQISAIGRNHCHLSPEITQYTINIKDTDAVCECILDCQPDYIFHLAAYKERNENIGTFYSSIETNLIGSLNVFSAAVKVKSVNSVVTLGTAEEYGNNSPPFNERIRECPVTPYSFSKVCVSHMGELFFRLYDLPVTVIRPTLAYGPGQGTDMFLPALITSLLNNKPFAMTAGEQTRDFVYVDDVVDSLILASETARAKGQVINIGSGIPLKLADIAKKIEIMTGRNNLINLGGKPYRKKEIMDYYVDLKKAKSILGWNAKTSLDEGLNKTIAYYRRL